MPAQQLEGFELDETSVLEEAVRSLAASLGFDSLEDEALFAPYITYVQAYWPGKGTKADFMRLFKEIVVYLRGTSFQ